MALVEGAGLRDVGTGTLTVVLEMDTPEEFMGFARDAAPIKELLEGQSPDVHERVWGKVTEAYAGFATPEGRVRTESERRTLRSAFVLYPRPWYWGIGALLVGGVFVSVLSPRDASLSCLWKEDPEGEVFEANVVGTQSEAEPLQWTLQGGFLSKTEGAWYALTEASRLQAIPDDESTRVVGGDFSVRYLEVGGDGAPVGEPVPEEDMKSRGTYVAVKHCAGFPAQPTITKLGDVTVCRSNSWVREPTQGE